MFFDSVLEEPDQRSVESAKYDITFYYLFTLLGFFFHGSGLGFSGSDPDFSAYPDPDFSAYPDQDFSADPDPDFWPIRTQTKKSDPITD